MNGKVGQSQSQGQQQQAQKCPRCDSMNTKFCYYNNYSLSQPRYLCKSCRRYWTKGGFLRNVPVRGGTSRKSRRTNNNKTLRLTPNHPSSTNHMPGSGEGHNGNFNDTSHVEGCDIDMAVVFANYLSSGHDDVAQPLDHTVVDGGEGLVLPPPDESPSVAAMRGIELEWESMLGGGGEVVEDVFSLLSDGNTTSSNSSSVMWQTAPLMEDLDINPLLPTFNYDDEVSDHLPIADSWNWSTFDVSTTFPAFSSSSSRPLDL